MATLSDVEPEVNAIRQVAVRWAQAVAASNLAELRQLMTEDIVVVHGNGRLLSGKQAVLADFSASFERYRVNQEVVSEETVVAGDWAFDRARVRTAVSARDSGESKEFVSRTLTILRREPTRGWCVARAIGVVEQ